MFKFSNTEKGILITVGAILLFFSYLLYDDSLFSQEYQPQTNSIGNVSFSENDVRKKSRENFSWLPIVKKDTVFQEDSIYTGGDSNAEITLEDGSVIEIQPNSLVTISASNGQMSLNLSYGNLVGKVAKNSALTIQSGEEEFKLKGDNSKIQFKKSNTGKVDVSLISGQGSVSTKSGKPIELKKIVEDAAAKLELLTPNGTTISKLIDSDPVQLQWKGNNVISKYELKVAKDAKFLNLVSQDSTKNQKINITKNLTKGTYYWQVNAYKKDGTLAISSEVRDFNVNTFKAPEITSPQAKTIVSLEIQGKQEELQGSTKVTWSSSEEYTQYRFQLSKNSDFKEILKDIMTPAKESMTPDLSSGTYHVRVLGTDSNNKISSHWSEPISFKLDLVAMKEQPPEPPTLLTNKIFFKVPNSTDRSPAAIAGPVIGWKPVENIPKYRLEIAKAKDFIGRTEFILDKDKTAWSKYRPGKYYYRVYSISESGLASAPSELGEMTVHVDNPILSNIAPIHLRGSEAPGPQNIKISWSQVPFAKSYVLQYDKNENFSNPEQLMFPSSEAQIQLPTPGKYHVRVKAVDENKSVLSGYSNNGLAVYLYDNPLMTPVLNEPFDKASIFLQKETSPYVWLEWKYVDGAQNYMIEISNTPDFSNVLVKKSVSENRFLINDKIPTGKIFWRVRAMSIESKSESDWSQQREFILFQKKNEIFIK